MPDRGARAALLATVLLSVEAHAASTAAPARNAVIEEITVSSTPLGGLELPADRVPGNVQRASSAALEHVRRAGIAQFLDQRLGSVFINEAQANPLQPDVQFRGFVASPLLGQPQGVAVYQNGVRINDPFGDVVAWALVPETALASVELIPGSNPVFGLNALGGALSLRTKTGFDHSSTHAELLGGSSDRRVAEIESGGRFADRFAYYASARYLTEEGWRDFSPSDALQLFADVGWRSGTSSLHLNLTSVSTDLIGNGPAPAQLLRLDREAIYTHPDRTENRLTMATLSGSHRFTPTLQLQAVGYVRRSDVDALNGDESNYEACDADARFVCEDGVEPAFDVADAPIAFDPAIDGAALNRSDTRQETIGASVQLGATGALFGRDNRFILGAALDRSTVRFASNTELGMFDEERGVIGGGVTPAESLIDLDATLDNLSVFFTNTLALTPAVDLVLAARRNAAHVQLDDQRGTELNGDHRFSRFNKSAGVSFRPARGLNVYANYAESNRAPSPVELTCADEDDPCALPNAFLSDPPLEQVVGKTIETGARGVWRGARWHAGWFRTSNQNDILFVSAGALTNRGFFDNVGDTRRQGVELNVEGALLAGRIDWFAHYTYLQAQFREDFVVASPNNPAAVNGEVRVTRGSRIPGAPERLFKAGVSFQATDAVLFSVDASHQSNQYLRGDEGNLTEPLAGFTVYNLSAEWELHRRLTLFAQVENLLDADYNSFGLYGASDEVLEPQFADARFVSPGAPRRVWVGIKWTL